MNKETKIGMLVGLCVIVLIGVLLSEYLGNGTSGQRMADLDKYKGPQYRDNMTRDVGTTSVKGIQPGTGDPVVARADESDMPVAFADGSQGPLTRQPVTPQGVGPVPADPRQDGGQPVLMGDLPNDGVSTPQVAQGGTQIVIKQYVIQKNDTVRLLAKKFYNSADAPELAGIVAANPGTLKDANTALVAGKKLNIPLLATSPWVTGAAVAHQVSAMAPPAQGATKTYTVVKGDTISTIAKKTLGTGGPIAVGELMKANGLKDGAIIKEGAVLRIPVRTGGAGQ